MFCYPGMHSTVSLGLGRQCMGATWHSEYTELLVQLGMGISVQ